MSTIWRSEESIYTWNDKVVTLPSVVLCMSTALAITLPVLFILSIHLWSEGGVDGTELDVRVGD